MSPTVFKKAGFRFFFFSREEARPHVHELPEGRVMTVTAGTHSMADVALI